MRRLADSFSIAGGFAAILFPLVGYWFAYVQNAYFRDYSDKFMVLALTQSVIRPMAGWVLASNQVFMYLYLLPYIILLQRPSIKVTYRRLGIIVPVYLLIGIINAVVNFGLLSKENVKCTLTTVAFISNIIVIVLCVLTLAAGFLMMTKTNSSQKVAAEEDKNDDKHFNKGKTAEEQAANDADRKMRELAGD